MRYIIYGAGAIGGVIGARLFAAGLDTVLICRGAHLEAIRSTGLVLREPDRERRLMAPAVGHPRDLTFRDGDVVILTMKAQDTPGALDDIEAAGGFDLPIVCCQNGVANEPLAARRFERVYGMLVALPATFMEPGVVLGWSTPVAGVLDVGCFPSGTDALIEQVAAGITSAGFICRPDPAVMRLKYAKLLTNLGNALQVVASMNRRDERARELMRKIRNEALACYEAAGIDCADADEYQHAVNGHYTIADKNIAGEQRSGSSTWQSLAKGHQKLETDYLNGEIVLLGKLHGVPTPYNAALRRLSQQLAATGGQAGAYTLDDIEAAAG
ncbi:MAG: ketopantoate reductase family protein [Dehalococcoidia bacterium]